MRFPKLGDAAFDGHLNFNARLQKFMDQGGKVYACRFALQALYGHGEKALMPGITPVNPLDVLDIVLMHRKAPSFLTPGRSDCFRRLSTVTTVKVAAAQSVLSCSAWTDPAKSAGCHGRCCGSRGGTDRFS